MSCMNVGSRYTRRRSPSLARPPLLPSRPLSGLRVKSAAAEHPAAQSGPRDFFSTAAVSAQGPPAGFMIAAAQCRHGQRAEKPRCGRRLESLELRHTESSESPAYLGVPSRKRPRHLRYPAPPDSARQRRLGGGFGHAGLPKLRWQPGAACLQGACPIYGRVCDQGGIRVNVSESE